MGLIKELLDNSIKATHRRPRKAVSSQSVVKFKREKQKRKRQYVYPSNWGEFMLYCKTGWLLQILPNGFVNGTNDLNSPYGMDFNLKLSNHSFKSLLNSSLIIKHLFPYGCLTCRCLQSSKSCVNINCKQRIAETARVV